MNKVWSVILASLLLFSQMSYTSYAATAISKKDLESYLKEVNMTQAELEDYLLYYDVTLKEFDSIDDLRGLLGPALNPSSLQTLLDDYKMTEAELTSLLIDYGELEEDQKILDHFHFVSDVEDIILLDQGLSDVDWTELYDGLSSEFGIEEAEMERLFNYLEPIFETPEIEDQLTALSKRMEQFPYFETIDDMTAKQVTELLSIYNDLQNILQVQFKYSLVKDGATTPISILELLKLEELNDADLIVSIYDLNGNILLDFTLTGEMFDSKLIQETGQDLKEAPAIIKQVKSTTTVKGGILPKTDGNYLLNSIFGILLISLSVVLFRKVRMN